MFAPAGSAEEPAARGFSTEHALVVTKVVSTAAAAMGALATSVRRGALGRLTVERADGTSILGTGEKSNALRHALEAAGFIATPRGLRLRA